MECDDVHRRCSRAIYHIIKQRKRNNLRRINSFLKFNKEHNKKLDGSAWKRLFGKYRKTYTIKEAYLELIKIEIKRLKYSKFGYFKIFPSLYCYDKLDKLKELRKQSDVGNKIGERTMLISTEHAKLIC